MLEKLLELIFAPAGKLLVFAHKKLAEAAKTGPGQAFIIVCLYSSIIVTSGTALLFTYTLYSERQSSVLIIDQCFKENK